MLRKAIKNKITVCLLCLTIIFTIPSLALAKTTSAGNLVSAEKGGTITPKSIHYHVTATTDIRSRVGVILK